MLYFLKSHYKICKMKRVLSLFSRYQFNKNTRLIKFNIHSLLRLQRKVYVSNRILSYFLLNEWKFYNAKFKNLFDTLSADNEKEFGYPYKSVDIPEYLK